MHSLVVTLAALLVLAPSAPSQADAPAPPAQDAPAQDAAARPGLIGETGATTRKFEDADYSFTFDVPVGFALLPDDVRAELPGQSDANEPRSDSKTLRLEHNFVWVDRGGPEGAHRQLELVLMDESKWAGPGDFQRWLESSGIAIHDREKLVRPVGPGLLLDATVPNPTDQRTMRMSVIYLARANRYALLKIQCYEEDWDLHAPAFRQMIETVRFRERVMVAPPTDSPFLQRQAGTGPSNPWLRLEVLGSLLLSAGVVTAMAFGSRARS